VYGAEAATAFEQAKKALGAFGRGKLVVRSSVDTGVIFINEHITQAGTLTQDDLLTGDYRVFVLLPGKQLSRQHRVTVRAKETTVVTIDAAFDVVSDLPQLDQPRSAHTSREDRGGTPSSSGAPSCSGRDRRDRSGARRCRRRILVNRNRGIELRRASIPLDPAPFAELLEALALFLAGDGPAPEGVDVGVVTT
jgi:hypothetical protein